MAKAKKLESQPIPPPFEVKLTLTKEEAHTLYRICGYLINWGQLRNCTSRIFDSMDDTIFDKRNCKSPFTNYTANLKEE